MPAYLSLHEVKNGVEEPIGEILIPSISSGNESEEQVFRIYNDKHRDHQDATDAKNVRLTVVDHRGQEQSVVVRGTSPDFLPLARGRCTTVCQAAKEVFLGSGNGSQATTFKFQPGGSRYVPTSLLLKAEWNASSPVEWRSGSQSIDVFDDPLFRPLTISYLPPSFDVIVAGATRTYYTQGAQISATRAKAQITLDYSTSGPNQYGPPSGLSSPLSFNLAYRFLREVPVDAFDVDYTADPAIVTFKQDWQGAPNIWIPQMDCRVFGSWTYRTPGMQFSLIGGSQYMLPIGGDATEIPPSAPVGKTAAAVVNDIPVGSYAEIVFKFSIPANTPPTPNLPFQFKLIEES